MNPSLWYRWVRRGLFTLDAERAHWLGLSALEVSSRLRTTGVFAQSAVDHPVTLMGLRFPNRIGLAAGFDKNGDYLNALGALGFGFIELGTVTPRPQSGNPRPRLFRLPGQHALINRMGFNNKGVEHLVRRLSQRRYSGIVGVNIGKNRETAAADAITDYRFCLRSVYAHADYVAVNISSPNTPGLRDLQHGGALRELLAGLSEERQALQRQYQRRVPLLIKVSPDLDDAALSAFAAATCEAAMDGVIAANTTVQRDALAGVVGAAEEGGLSGAPLREPAKRTLRALRQRLGTEMPIIGVGGIDGADAAVERRQAGADLVAIYTGLIYTGPALVHECARALASVEDRRGA